MKQIILIFIACVMFSISLFAQKNSDELLKTVEQNNSTLAALRQRVEADKIGNKTGIYLNNPEVEFNYLWGSPSEIENRTNFSVKQSFDFPTAYGHKRKIAGMKNEQAELEYQKERMTLLLQVRLLVADLIYYNALRTEGLKRINDAQIIADACQVKFDFGDISILEYNKAQLNLFNAANELESIAIERSALLSELVGLNGGQSIEYTDSVFQESLVPVDFEQWYLLVEQSNPVLRWVKQEIAISEKQVSLSKAMNLPKIEAGYMSEKVVGEKFQGLTLGLSIPLRENKNRVKYARANTEALQGIESDRKLQYYNELKRWHSKAKDLQRACSNYRRNLQQYDHSELLKKAYDKKEISLIDYMLERSIFYESVDKLLELQREQEKAMAHLEQYLM